MKFQITFLGANCLFGRVASTLLKNTPSVRKLKLYDELDTAHLGQSATESSCLVQWHNGKAQLTNALEGSDIIVIGDDRKPVEANEKDSLLLTASKVVDYVFAIAHTVPKAMLVVAASPLNLMVPLVGYVLKELGCYDGRKLLGVTSIDTLRANALYSSYLSQSNSILPVVGGASPQTRVPIFSHAKPCLQIPEEDQHQMIEQIKSFDLHMQGQDTRASTIERAYATVRLVHSLISGLLEEPYTSEMALAKTTLIPEVNYFSLPVDLGRSGIERTFGLPQLSHLEKEMIEYAVINLNNDLMKAHDLYSMFKPCLEMVRTITGSTPSSKDRCKDILNDRSEKIVGKSDIGKDLDTTKVKTYKRKRSEIYNRNRKKTTYPKFPIIHCPAFEVVKDKPKAEKFCRIKRVHKKLQIYQVLPERKLNELPALWCTKTNRKNKSYRSPIHKLMRMDKLEEITEVKRNSISNEATDKGTKSNTHQVQISENILTNVEQGTKITKDTGTISTVNKDVSQVSETMLQSSEEKNKTTNIDYRPGELKLIEEGKSPQQKTTSENNKAIATVEKEILERIRKLDDLRNNKIKSDNVENYFKVGLNKKSSSSNLKSNMNEKEISNPQCKSNYARKDNHEQNFAAVSGSLVKNEIAEPNLSQCIKSKGEHDIGIGKDFSVQKSITEKTMEFQKETNVDFINSPCLKESIVKVKKEENKYISKPISEEYKIKKMPAIAFNKDVIEHSINKSEINNKKGSQKNKSYIIKSVKHEENSDKGKTVVVHKNYLEEGDKISKVLSNQKINNFSKEIVSTKQKEELIIESKIFMANLDPMEDKNQAKGTIPKRTPPKVDGIEEKEIMKDKVLIASKQVLDQGDKTAIDAKEKLKDIELSLEQVEKDNNRVKDVTKQQNKSMYNIDRLEQGNKIREITQQKLKEPHKKFRDNLKQDNKKLIKKETKSNEKEDEGSTIKLPENIHVFNYQADLTKDNRRMTNIDDMLQDLVKENIPEVPSVVPTDCSTVQQKIKAQEEIIYISDDPYPKLKEAVTAKGFESPINIKPTECKEFNLTPNINKIKTNKKISDNETKQLKYVTQEEKIKEQTNINCNSEQKKSLSVVHYPFFNKVPKLVEDALPKNIWLKPKTQSPNECSPINVNLDEVIENKNVSVTSHNIDESFTKRKITNFNQSIYKTNDKKPVSYTIDTKTKRDDLPKRYTILKKGQICSMVKEDINANELKAKLYKKSVLNSSSSMNNKLKDVSSVDAKDLQSEFKISKNNDTNITGLKSMTKPYKNSLKSSHENEPALLQPLFNEGEMDEKSKSMKNDTKDVTPSHNLNQINKNPLSMKNKSFFNMVLNRISKRSPSLNETTDSISIRGSHNASVNSDNCKKPLTPDEREIINQQLIKKAKDQLKMTKIKNNKKGFSGFKGGFPVVSNEIVKQQPKNNKEERKIISATDTSQKTAQLKNKMQMFKERCQHLKSTKSAFKNCNISPAAGQNKELSDKQKTKETVTGFSSTNDSKKSTLGTTFSLKVVNTSGNNKSEEKKGSTVIKNDENRLQQERTKDFISSFEKPVKELANNLLEKINMNSYETSLINGKDESLVDAQSCLYNSHEINDTRLDNVKSRPREPELIPPEPTSIQTTVSILSDKTTEPIKPQSQEIRKVQDKFEYLQDSPNTPKQMSNIVEGNSFSSRQSKTLNEEINLNVNKDLSNNLPQQIKPFTPKKKVFQARALMSEVYSSTSNNSDKKDMKSLPDISSKQNKKKSENLMINPIDKLSKIKKDLSNCKPMNEKSTIEPKTLNIFANRPSSKDLVMQKTGQNNEVSAQDTKSLTEKTSYSGFKLGFRGMVERKLIAKQSSASSLLLDPNHENRTFNRKEIHPSLMHAVKPFASLNTDPKNKFYLRWTPHSLKPNKESSKVDKERDKQNGLQPLRNPFVSGKINMTSDLFKEYMKNNRNHDLSNSTSNGDIPFLHQPSPLAPSQCVSTNTARIKDQRVTFSTLETNPDQKKVGKNDKPINSNKNISNISITADFVTAMRPTVVPKSFISGKASGRSQESVIKKPIELTVTKTEVPLKPEPTKRKNSPYSSYKPYPTNKPQIMSTYHTQNNKFSGKNNILGTQFRNKDKEEELKRMHLLKAFQNQEKTEQKFEELQRNFKKQQQLNTESSIKTPSRVFRTLYKERPVEGSLKRLHMLKAFTNESFKNGPSENNHRTQRSYSAPNEYHPSFPLSKPKRQEKEGRENKREDTGNTLKKRWTQLLDIFQSVITTEKKNWEQDRTEENLLLTDGSTQAKNNTASRTNYTLTDNFQKSKTTAKKVQSYYRRHSSGNSKVSTRGSTNKRN